MSIPSDKNARGTGATRTPSQTSSLAPPAISSLASYTHEPSPGDRARETWIQATGLPFVHSRFMEEMSGSVSAYLQERIDIPERHEQRRAVVLISSARCASSAFLTAMSLSGLPEGLDDCDLELLGSLHQYQPIKMLLRRGSGDIDELSGELYVNHESRMRVPPVGQGVLAHRPLLQKEVYGPYQALEIFDTLQILENAGYGREFISAVFMFRRPDHCWDSWKRMFKTRTSFELFVQVYKEVYRQYQCSRASCARALPLVTESLTEEVRRKVLIALFEEVGLPYSEHAIHWRESSYFQRRIVSHTKNPTRFHIGISAGHKQVGELKYRAPEVCPLSGEELAALGASGLWQLYDSVVADVERHFRVSLHDRSA